MHTGRKGMKWGQHIFTQDIKMGKDKPKMSTAERVVSEAQKGSENRLKSRRLKGSQRQQKKMVKTLSQISTEDLRKIVSAAKERKQLEDDYLKYVAGTIDKGKQKVDDRIERFGAYMAAAGSVVTIASSVATLIGKVKNGKKDDDD